MGLPTPDWAVPLPDPPPPPPLESLFSFDTTAEYRAWVAAQGRVMAVGEEDALKKLEEYITVPPRPKPKPRPKSTPRPKPASLPKGDTIGPIRAWRLWQVDQNNFGEWRLFSVTRPVMWQPGRPMRLKVPPSPYGTVGIYAVKDRAYPFSYLLDGLILGEVALWGKVIEHADGYRAEVAYPIRLHWRPPMPGFPVPRACLAVLASDYGIPVVVERDL